jgi:hypothetical protein
MSFALEYLSPGGRPPSFEEIEEWRLEIPHFENSTERDGVRTWWYRNPDTSVYFVLSLYAVKPTEDGTPGPCGLEFSLNHLRPSFFAEEAAPIMASLAQCLGLTPCDGSTGTPLAGRPDGEEIHREIVALWGHGNAVAIDDAAQQGRRLNFLHPEAARRWWEYSRRRQAARNLLSDRKIEAEVPALHFLKAPHSGKVVTAMAWENEGATLFPPCDIMVIDRTTETRKLFRKTVERKVAYVSTELFMRQIVGALKPFEVDGLNLRLLLQEDAWKAIERIPSLSQELKEDISDFKPLRPDQILDEEP